MGTVKSAKKWEWLTSAFLLLILSILIYEIFNNLVASIILLITSIIIFLFGAIKPEE